jgi:hypothetical protein
MVNTPLDSSPANSWLLCCIMFFMTGLNERVIQEMERLLQRPLTSEEVRLLLLANVIEEDILDRETSLHLAA